MNLQFTTVENAFREEVRTFLAEALPSDIQNKVRLGQRLSAEEHIRWQNRLNERGWLAPSWPVEHGGTGWSPVEKYIFEEECAAAHAPTVVPFGVNMVAPVIIRFGSEAQKRYYLPRILNNTDWWCQGYSEPGAGSDLAGLKTRAERDGDYYIVNGQKTWTTLGQHANQMFCLVRTDSQTKKQAGISFLLIDMNTPGITVRPIITLDGAHEVNEVFLDDVRVPVENRVGDEGEGWTCAKFLLTHERTGIAGLGHAKQALRHLKDVARRQPHRGRALIDSLSFREQIARAELELMALEVTNLRVLAAARDGGAPGAESSLLKIRGSELRQRLSDLTRRALGPQALPFFADFLAGDDDSLDEEQAFAAAASTQYFNRRKLSIYGGANEIQKNIVAKTILGM
ncbi:alkylation response protein AidB-like acyl-CoA dehydrogenase [Modicisalibacter xianhensis]|uniref:Alkylation response protein AidB-like acyl-CoA dehydrogenase n=1 Tax=Modicisalibacter xianhensis TaxID=442341 RepID=A0A4R8FKH8_9GAMM|nr:acyl-CoA dehydrogenase family protein [Halomonas xianhensis]TDX26740.1 alkylation response protein AidB-like acyl-CoA dehydrogenase [Halomonas xianhensis]